MRKSVFRVFDQEWVVMHPTLKKLVGHITFGVCVRGSHFLVPTLTFKPLKLES